MNVLYAVIAENAHLRHDGRMDVHGIFHELAAPAFPARQDSIALVVVLQWDADERGDIDFSISLLDPSRSPVLTANAQTEVRDEYAIHRPARTPLVIPLETVVFPRPGAYEFELTVGDQKQTLAPLYLIEDPQAR